MTKKTAPVVIEMEEAPTLTPANAPVVPEIEVDMPKGQAVQTLALLTARRPSFLWRLFWGVLLALLGAMISIAAWDFAVGLLGRNLWLGRIVLGGFGLFIFAALGLALREWLSLARLRKVDGLRSLIEGAFTGDLAAARDANARLKRFYRGREDLRWALDNLAALEGDILDGDALLATVERTLMAPLDSAARREVEASARQVASITAIVPLALADVVVALTANLRMVRRIAEIYGGRAGAFGSWRLLKTVLLHLVATGAVAVGDDLIGSVLGGGLVSKISRRFGEGVVNGALTARVGVAAMEVCRPMPFRALKRPKVTLLVKNALAGLFSRG
ncbi:MAG: TIGR01620 family protein [Alphaproteobacteria bacterium]|nr:TIGR01620 family protein [Alphaproteobacteria bacterium]